MAFDAFLKIDGLDGESTRKGFEKQMEIKSFSWGATNPATIGAGGGGGGAGKVSITSFNISKMSDVASPLLFQSCCKGIHYPKAVVTLIKSGGKSAFDFIKYEFENVYVESVQWSGATGGDDTPLESVSLAFSKVSFTYTPQNPDGSKGSPAVGAWDLTTGSA
jgi:type VI secretion system secreted protein Hcp